MVMTVLEGQGLAVPAIGSFHLGTRPCLSPSGRLRLLPLPAPSFFPVPFFGDSQRLRPACLPPPPGGEWRLKYERAVREVDFTKKRLQQEFEDKLEVEQQNKRQLERRVSLPEAAEAWAWEGREGLGPPCWPRQGPGRPTLGAAGEDRRARLSVRGPSRANGCLSVFVS